MSSMAGNKVKITIFGQSHSRGLGVVIDGLPAGQRIDLEEVNAFLQRRAGGKNAYSTARKEKDLPVILSGLVDEVTCGAPLCATFENADTRSGDYANLQTIPRPSHADYAATAKHGGFEDKRGGGHFSGRLTLPLCFAGAVCLQLLRKEGIHIGAHILSIADVSDAPYDEVALRKEDLHRQGFPAQSPQAELAMVERMERAAKERDSVGGVIECGIIGVNAGLGEPMFDSLESRLAHMLFSVPAVKGVEFGAGFGGTALPGSLYNDPFYYDEGVLKTRTNNCGGIQGGISNGMPIILRVAFKPTPSISLPQESVNLETKQPETLVVRGRHDPCIVPRAVPCVEAACALVLYDMLLG